MSGRLAKAPCGHDGEYVIGQYVRCLRSGCDGAASDNPRCPKCDSKDTEPYRVLGWSADTWRCLPHGHVWSPSVSYL